MYTFFMMLKDLFTNGKIHIFVLFYIFIFVRWGIIYSRAVKYRPFEYEGDPKLFTSVLIPVVDEPLDLFDQVLTSISSQSPSEIIVVINGPKNTALEKLCDDFNTRLKDGWTPVKHIYTSVAGKRNAIRLGLEHTDPKSDISVLVDSDTLWTENALKELLKPFACDENIGGVTTRQKIIQPERKLVTMFANILEEIRAEGSMKAMSVQGKVGCLPGRTIAFRTSIMRQVIDTFMTETFMGFHKEVSDDRSLTNLALKMGYKTVMQDTSVVYTDAPVTWKKFIRQQLRWAEGSQYNNLRMTPWMAKNSKLMLFIYWTDMLMPSMLISLYANILIFRFAHITTRVPSTIVSPSFLVSIVLIFIGCILSFGARNIKVMMHQKWYYTLLIPVFIIILTAIMVPVRIIGLMSCSKDMGWGTRKLSDDDAETEKAG